MLYIFIIWLTGFIISYIIVRKILSKGHCYTVARRMENVRYSLFSWFMVIIMLTVAFEEWYDKVKDNEVKW